MNKERIIILLLVGVMLFSVLGTGLLFIMSADDNKKEEVAEGTPSQTCPEVPKTEKAMPSPEVFIPDGDVTELKIEDIKVGDGKAVKASDSLKVHYHGSRAKDGCVFDSSYFRGEPAEFPLSDVIQGWQTGLLGMKEGGTRRLVIPSDQAYGPVARSEAIGADEDLVFYVELLEIVKPKAQ